MSKKDISKNANEFTKYDSLSWYTDEEKSVFVSIDRDQEDRDVDRFQKTKNNDLFEKIYNTRIQTLQIWARRYGYLMDNSSEDMFSEFCVVFTKAIFTYKRHKGNFNTYLWRLLLNFVHNLQTGRRAKKRLPDGVDPNSMGKFMLSLDYSYDGKDGSENTLKDVIADKGAIDGGVNKLIMDETIDVLSNKNEFVSSFLQQLGNGNTIASLLRKYKTKKGKIKISRTQIKKLRGKRKQKRLVSELIRNYESIDDDFCVLDYSIENPNKLFYIIEMKKTKEADYMMRTIRKLRKDKRALREKISE